MNGPKIELENPDRMGFWRYLWMYWLATFRLSKTAVCVMSRNKGVFDFHDYHDTAEGLPEHFVLQVCDRCGKEFTI